MNLLVIAVIFAMTNTILTGAIERRETLSNEKKLFVSLKPEHAMAIIPTVTACMENTGINFEGITELIEAKEHGGKEVENFISCAFKNAGYADNRGNVNINKFMSLFPNIKERGAIRKVVEECDNLMSKTVANKLRLFIVCFLRKSPVLITL